MTSTFLLAAMVLVPCMVQAASPSVPLDSWIYPALDRLAAFGYLDMAYAGMRPWTRRECARLLHEARVDEISFAGSDAYELYRALTGEFAVELNDEERKGQFAAELTSLYARTTTIAGPPLRDGFHFGQTIVNDDGRPYAEGLNSFIGFSGVARAGPFSLFMRAEFERAPSVPSDPVSVLDATAQQDLTRPLANGSRGIHEMRWLDSTVAWSWRSLQFSFGKQSLWLGPGESGPFLFSNNAAPMPMFRIDQTSPVRLPFLSRWLGPVRGEFFLGRLSGQRWVFSNGKLFGPNLKSQPFIHGVKVGFKPTSNLEFGMGYTILLGGPGLPMTWGNFFRSFTSFNETPGSAADPGDRRSTFDFSYRVPYLRHWLTVYLDSLVDDEFSPLGSTRPSLRTGIYLSHLPKMPKVDLRLEGLYTDVPGQKNSGFLYWNGRYRSGYTNDGNLLGSWIGRQSRGGQAWMTWWLSPRDKIQLTYRHAEADRTFIGGGRLNDVGANGEIQLRQNLSFLLSAQYEAWMFPVLSSRGKKNFTTTMQLMFHPHWRVHR